MSSYKIKRLGLPKNIIAILEKQNLLTCKDVLSLTVLELQALFGINFNEATRIQTIISKKCVSEPCTVYDQFINQRKIFRSFLPFALRDLDILLQGTLLLGTITEIVGPPGVGKTQLCFLLSILTTLPTNVGGLDGQVIYIDTESAFSAKRVEEMARCRYPEIFKTENDIVHLLQQIFVYKATSVYSLKEIIFNVEKEIIKKNVKLVIIDSIASLYRKEYGASILQSIIERNNVLLKQAALLKDMAQTYGIVIFLTNQITSHSAECDPTLSEYLQDSDVGDCDTDILTDLSESSHPVSAKKSKLQRVNTDYVTPALGMTWFHCVNTRLMAHFLDSKVRQLFIAKSPSAPNVAMQFILNETGIVPIGSDVEFLNTSIELINIFTKNNFLTGEITGTGNVFSVDI